MVKEYLQSEGFSRLITLIVLVLLLISIGSMVNIVLFTFVFTFLMGRLEQFIMIRLNKVMRINSKVVISFLYIILISCLAIVLYKYLPVITLQFTELVTQIVFFFQHPPDSRVIQYAISLMNETESPLDLQKQMNTLYLYVSDFGKLALQIFLSILLSLFSYWKEIKLFALLLNLSGVNSNPSL